MRTEKKLKTELVTYCNQCVANACTFGNKNDPSFMTTLSMSQFGACKIFDYDLFVNKMSYYSFSNIDSTNTFLPGHSIWEKKNCMSCVWTYACVMELSQQCVRMLYLTSYMCMCRALSV